MVTGVGLRQCTLGLRPYMGHELAVVRSQGKCGVAGMRREWERGSCREDGVGQVQLGPSTSIKKPLKWVERVFCTLSGVSLAS